MKKVRPSPPVQPPLPSAHASALIPSFQDVLIVNTSRGPVINESDLVDALESGQGQSALFSFLSLQLHR